MGIIILIVVAAGLVSGFLLFYRLPTLEAMGTEPSAVKVSVIIPARNEESKISDLLQDLLAQTYPVHDILCVDDCSTDRTLEIARSFGINTMSITEKPEGWIGKSWACHQGAQEAEGELFLFLDADVRLSKDGIGKLIHAYDKNKCTLSVQPYHIMEKSYEGLSLFFNMMQIAAYGLGLPFRHKKVGLYGPVILIPAEVYGQIGGHAKIRRSIVDDVALGKLLNREGIPYSLYIGDRDISFRMYGDGFKYLLQGWIKNVAAGAMYTHFYLLLMVCIWVVACAGIVLYLLAAFLNFDKMLMFLLILLYGGFILEIGNVARKLGNFSLAPILFFPLTVWFFIGIFTVSLFKKVFHIKVMWKDRKIEVEK